MLHQRSDRDVCGADHRQASTARDRKCVHSPPGCAWSVPHIEPQHVRWNFDTGRVVNPLPDLAEPLDEKVTIKMRPVGDREIEVFGEAVGFKETLFQAGAALEYPDRRQNLIMENPREYPPQHIVLLDNLWTESEIACKARNLLAANHERFSA